MTSTYANRIKTEEELITRTRTLMDDELIAPLKGESKHTSVNNVMYLVYVDDHVHSYTVWSSGYIYSIVVSGDTVSYCDSDLIRLKIDTELLKGPSILVVNDKKITVIAPPESVVMVFRSDKGEYSYELYGPDGISLIKKREREPESAGKAACFITKATKTVCYLSDLKYDSYNRDMGGVKEDELVYELKGACFTYNNHYEVVSDCDHFCLEIKEFVITLRLKDGFTFGVAVIINKKLHDVLVSKHFSLVHGAHIYIYKGSLKIYQKNEKEYVTVDKL